VGSRSAAGTARLEVVRAVVQRVSSAAVAVGGATVAEIGPGLLVLLGVAVADDEVEAERVAGKVARLRIFESADGKFDRSLLDTAGAALVVSQFTLIADTAKGNRPSFSGAARPERAQPLYERFCDALRELGVPVQTGVFGARMAVTLVNDGPVTIVLG
jgi:D-tyrosyl-tRNA(Tyr) deacylase